MAIHRRYNPGFLADEELIDGFCVRTHEFKSIVATLRDTRGSAGSHMLVIGPRGSGKTSLLLRVAAEIRVDQNLARRLLPVALAEESYNVSSCGEFWLECVYQLGQQLGLDGPGADARDMDLHRSWEDLRSIQDDQTLEQRSLGTLMNVSGVVRRRLVLVVENLDALFRDMANPVQAGWRLRHALQNEPRLILLASATSRFDAIDRPDRALYDLLHAYTLQPLDTSECAALWESVSGTAPPYGTARSLEVLTGGNPRLLAIVARFGAHLSLDDLMGNLLDLVDEHTEYFRSHLEALPAHERRVYLALAELWKPATAREVAERARIDSSKCSSWLKRLVERGAVTVVGGTARRKEYYVTERMYNIYYLLRRHRGSSRVVEALVRFMVAFYSHGRLRELLSQLAVGAKTPRGATGHYPHAPSTLAVAVSEPTRVQADPVEGFWVAVDAYLAVLSAGEHRDAAVALGALADVVYEMEGWRAEARDELVTVLRCGRALHRGLAGQGDRALADLLGIERDSQFAGLGPLAQLAHALCEHFVLRSLSRLKEARRAAAKVLDVVEGLKVPAEQYFTFLLARTPDTGLASVEADLLVTLCAFIGSSRALELIEESGTGDSVVPLVAALQMDLRQGSRHAQEVREVAADILHRINRTREFFGKAERALSSTEFRLRFDSIGRRFRRWLGGGEAMNPPHPSETIRFDCIEASGLTVTQAAATLGCSRPALLRLLNGRAGISPEMALAFERQGWSNADFWMRLQAAYDLAQARRRVSAA